MNENSISRVSLQINDLLLLDDTSCCKDSCGKGLSFSIQFFHAVKAGESELIANIGLNYSLPVIGTARRIKALK